MKNKFFQVIMTLGVIFGAAALSLTGAAMIIYFLLTNDLI